MHHRAVMILILVIASAVALTMPATAMADTELSIVITDSMDGQPTGYPIRSIPKDSLIIVDTSVSGIQAGDVVGYRTPLIDGTVYHRVTSVDGDIVHVKGDNLDLEETIRTGDITGKVIFVSGTIGKMISFVKDNNVPLLMILLGAYLLLSKEPSREKGQGSEEI